VTSGLESRVRQLEDRVQISEQVIKYAMGVDRRDWAMFAGCFTDPVYADFSGGGIPGATVPRGFVAILAPGVSASAASALPGADETAVRPAVPAEVRERVLQHQHLGHMTPAGAAAP